MRARRYDLLALVVWVFLVDVVAPAALLTLHAPGPLPWLSSVVSVGWVTASLAGSGERGDLPERQRVYDADEARSPTAKNNYRQSNSVFWGVCPLCVGLGLLP